MKPFTQIAIPHEDILEGRLTMDVFAADLWQVANGKAPLDYQDADLFFRKTYLTKGLKILLKLQSQGLKVEVGILLFNYKHPLVAGKLTHS